MSLYLLPDSRQMTAVRARLRQNKSSLHASLTQRRVLFDASCPECKAPQETTEHCLLECPRYSAARNECLGKLSQLQVFPGLDSLLGNVELLPPRQQNQVLTI